MPTYSFRKIYFICEDNKIFPRAYEVINCYRQELYAKTLCIEHQRMKIDDAQLLWNKGQKIPILKAEGFYLVHESLFEEILKKHSKEVIK